MPKSGWPSILDMPKSGWASIVHPNALFHCFMVTGKIWDSRQKDSNYILPVPQRVLPVPHRPKARRGSFPEEFSQNSSHFREVISVAPRINQWWSVFYIMCLRFCDCESQCRWLCRLPGSSWIWLGNEETRVLVVIFVARAISWFELVHAGSLDVLPQKAFR